jgi:hypothetical protein
MGETLRRQIIDELFSPPFTGGNAVRNDGPAQDEGPRNTISEGEMSFLSEPEQDG